VALRISGYERVPAGRPLGDTARIAPELVAAGVDAFHVSGGVIDRLTSQIVTGSHYTDGHNAAAAAAVKRAVDVPVMVVGRIHDPELAERILQRGQADLVAVARPLLADPEFARKARSGRNVEIRRCISCQNCIDSMEIGSMNCAVNGRSGRELERSLVRAERSKRVLVVGGGPAGLEAARLAALRGHRVTLCERQSLLGGALVLAAAVHADNESLLAFLLDQVTRLEIQIRLGESLSPEAIRSMAPDAAIIATGGRLVTPAIPGDHLPHVLSGELLRGLMMGSLAGTDWLRLPRWQRHGLRALAPWLARAATPARIRSLSRRWMPLGERVAVVGSDLASVELAEFLAERGRMVWLLAEADEIAPEIGSKRRKEHTDRLDRLGVVLSSGVACAEIVSRGVVVRGAGLVESDSVVLAGAHEADTELYAAVRDSVPEAFAIGDCTGLGLIRKAIDDATRVACAL
jgi:2,4-dienoyl-CoA reductase (NADPH2)